MNNLGSLQNPVDIPKKHPNGEAAGRLFNVAQDETSLEYNKDSSDSLPHRIHVWYIYLHLVDFYGKCR